MKTVKQTGKLNTEAKGFISESDIKRISERFIEYDGAGVYSMSDEKIYLKGSFPTYSRIEMK